MAEKERCFCSVPDTTRDILITVDNCNLEFSERQILAVSISRVGTVNSTSPYTLEVLYYR
jgi:hypothetical protein